MIYSCFDPNKGAYDYFEDGRSMPVNKDLPVPKMPAMAGTIGIPAMDAGRPLPRDARHVGEGWHAQGIVVQCSRSGGLGVDGTASEGWEWFKSGGWKWVVGISIGIWAVRRI